MGRKILFLAWRREATGAPSGLPASGSATVQLSRLLDHGIERRDWSPRRGSKFHRRTPHKRRAARLWRVVRSFVRLLHLHVHARARTRARVRSREGAKRRPVLEPAKSGRSKELRAAPAATHGRYCASAETTPYIRGNTRYALQNRLLHQERNYRKRLSVPTQGAAPAKEIPVGKQG